MIVRQKNNKEELQEICKRSITVDAVDNANEKEAKRIQLISNRKASR